MTWQRMVLAASVAITFAGMSGCSQNSRRRGDDSVPVNGLTLKLATDCREAQAGGEVALTLAFKNVSNQSFRLPANPWGRDGASLEWQVAGPVPEAAAAKWPLTGSMGVKFNADDYPELRPGEERSFSFKISGNPPTLSGELTNIVQFLKPGDYRIKASFLKKEHKLPVSVSAWSGQATSNQVELKLGGKFEPPASEPWWMSPDTGK